MFFIFFLKIFKPEKCAPFVFHTSYWTHNETWSQNLPNKLFLVLDGYILWHMCIIDTLTSRGNSSETEYYIVLASGSFHKDDKYNVETAILLYIII